MPCCHVVQRLILVSSIYCNSLTIVDYYHKQNRMHSLIIRPNRDLNKRLSLNKIYCIYITIKVVCKTYPQYFLNVISGPVVKYFVLRSLLTNRSLQLWGELHRLPVPTKELKNFRSTFSVIEPHTWTMNSIVGSSYYTYITAGYCVFTSPGGEKRPSVLGPKSSDFPSVQWKQLVTRAGDAQFQQPRASHTRCLPSRLSAAVYI